MFWQTKLAGACLTLLALAAVVLVADAQERGPNVRAEVRGLVKTIEAGKSITVTVGPGRENAPEKTFALAKDVEVAIGGGFRFGGLFKEGKLTDVTPGTMVSLLLSADQKTVESIAAEEPMLRAILKSVDREKGTLMARVAFSREPADDEKTFTLAKDVEVAVDDGRGRRFSLREGKLGDLREGFIVNLRLSLDKKHVLGIIAEAPLVTGMLKAIDPAKWTLTVEVRPARGDEAADERTLTLAKDALILTDDGRGRRLSLKEAKLADVPVGSAVMLRLDAGKDLVTTLRAEGPSLFGMLKSVDPAKGLITISLPKGRDDPQEKTLAVAKDARITLDGNEAKLGDLKAAENGPFIQLRLTLDQKTVQLVMARQPGTR